MHSAWTWALFPVHVVEGERVVMSKREVAALLFGQGAGVQVPVMVFEDTASPTPQPGYLACEKASAGTR